MACISKRKYKTQCWGFSPVKWFSLMYFFKWHHLLRYNIKTQLIEFMNRRLPMFTILYIQKWIWDKFRYNITSNWGGGILHDDYLIRISLWWKMTKITINRQPYASLKYIKQSTKSKQTWNIRGRMRCPGGVFLCWPVAPAACSLSQLGMSLSR